MPFEAYKVLSQILFHVSLTTNVRGVILLKLPTRKLKLRASDLPKVTQGANQPLSAICSFPPASPALLCNCRGLQAAVWLAGVCDRRRGGRWGEAYFSSLCLRRRLPQRLHVLWQITQLLPNNPLALGDLVIRLSPGCPSRLRSRCTLLLLLISGSLPSLFGFSALLSPVPPILYMKLLRLKELKWFPFSRLDTA